MRIAVASDLHLEFESRWRRATTAGRQLTND